VLRTTADDERQNAAFAAAAAGSPVVLLSPTASEQALGLAAESGAIVHLVEPVTTQALAAAVRLAVARAGDRRAAANELAKLRQSAASRELVERAKTILMTRFGFSEEEAHRRLQTESRIRNRKVAETAWHVIQADARLRGPRRYETAR
jgi:response regulator NasT